MPHHARKDVHHHRYKSADSPDFETISKQSIFGALLSRTLPQYHGPLPVGVCDIEVPVPHQTFGSFKSKRLGSDVHGAGGLSLDTVLFSLFYPTSQTESKEKVVWFPNLPQTIDGFLRMARRTPNWLYRALAYPIAAAAIYGTTFPAIPNAPFLPPPSIPEDPTYKWPLVIFSHGVGCSRLMYSTFCGEMASRGYVVCAIEHRDGTSPSSVIVMEDGKSKKVNFVCHQDLFWPDLPPHAQPPDDTHLRHVQLRMRLAEIEHVIAVMRCVTSGECSKKKPDVRTSVGKKQEYDWSKWTNGVDCRKGKVIMSGHSLGGSAAILACAEKKRFDFASVIAMDPAIQRIDPWRSKLPCPLLVVNSEEFTRSDDFPRLQRLCRYAQKGEGVFSIAGSTHPSFSDVFLIVPGIINRMIGLSTESPRVLSLAVNATAAFLQHGGDGRNHEFNTVTSEEETPTPTPPSRSNSHSHHHHRHSHLESPTSPKNLAKSAGIVIQVNTDDDGEANGFEDTASVTSSSSSHPSPTSPLSTSSHPPPLDPLAALDANEALRPLRERRGTVRVSGRGYFSDRYGSGSSAPASTSRINLGQYHTNGASRVSLAVKDWSSRVGGRIRGWSRSTSNTFSLSTPFGTPKPIPRPMGPSGVSSSTSGSASGSGSVIVDPPSDDESPSRSRRAEGLTLPPAAPSTRYPPGLDKSPIKSASHIDVASTTALNTSASGGDSSPEKHPGSLRGLKRLEIVEIDRMEEGRKVIKTGDWVWHEMNTGRC